MSERDEIERYYDEDVQTEWTRLDRHPTEFEFTRRHLESLFSAPADICDVGGGPGRYSLYFAERGNSVTLVDLSRNNLVRAEDEAKGRGLSLSRYIHASATELSAVADNSFDVVLCFGPLYHLTSHDERSLALTELTRILRMNGLLALAFLSPYSHAISFLKRKAERIDDSYEELAYIINHGRNRNPEKVQFTHAWYPKPQEICSYMEEYGLETERIAGVESLSWAIEEQLRSFPPQTRSLWMDYLYEVSLDPSTIGASQHILYCGRKVKDIGA